MKKKNKKEKGRWAKVGVNWYGDDESEYEKMSGVSGVERVRREAVRRSAQDSDGNYYTAGRRIDKLMKDLSGTKKKKKIKDVEKIKELEKTEKTEKIKKKKKLKNGPKKKDIMRKIERTAKADDVDAILKGIFRNG